MAMKLMKNAVPQTATGSMKAPTIICLIHTFPVIKKKHKNTFTEFKYRSQKQEYCSIFQCFNVISSIERYFQQIACKNSILNKMSYLPFLHIDFLQSIH